MEAWHIGYTLCADLTAAERKWRSMEKSIKKEHNWIKSFAVNAVILIAVTACTRLVYETNDDYAVASRIVDGYAEAFFVNYYLCRILIALQKIFTTVNVYVISQIAGAFISFVCVYKLILDTCRDRIVRIVSAMVILVFAFDHYCTIQFTKTSAIMLIAGTIVLVDALTEKRKWPYLLLSMALVYMGAAFRIDGLYVALAFMGLYFFDWLIRNRRTLRERAFFSGRRIVLYGVLIVLFAGCYGFQDLSNAANTATDALKEYDEYNFLRSAVVDYPCFEYYESNADKYTAAGFSENDLYLIDKWVFDYSGAASKENLAKIVEINDSEAKPEYTLKEASDEFIRKTVKSVKKKGFTGIHVVLLSLLALWMLLSLAPRHWLYIIAAGSAAACMHLALYYTQRPVYRAIYIADIGAAMWLLYMMSIYHDDEDEGGFRSKACTVFGILVIICTASSLVPLRDDCISAYKANEGRIMSDELYQYLTEHDDCFFTFYTREKKPNRSYAEPVLPPDTFHDRNVIGTGSWGTMSPYILGKLDAYGIYSPVADLIDNEKAFYVANDGIGKMTEYYNKWYGSDDKVIWLEEVDEVGGKKIWSVKSGAPQ